MAARAEVAAATRERYAAGGRAAKGAILDEFVALTGLHRKHAIRLLRAPPGERRPRGRPRTRYGAAVKEALVLLWEASDRVCSKRLVPTIPVLLPALERHGQLTPDEELRARLLAISPATIDRLLSETRIAAAQGRRRRAGFGSAVRRSVPVRTFGDWGDPPPGFVEVDFVAHSGVSAAGAFVREPGADRHRHRLDGVRAGRDAGGGARARGAAGGAGALPVPPSGRRLRQRRRLHERARGVLVQGTGARGHALPGLSQERPGLGGAEERGDRPTSRGPRPVRGAGLGRGPRAALRGGAAAHQSLPAELQAAREDPRRGPGDEALASAGHAGRSGFGLGDARRREHGAHP